MVEAVVKKAFDVSDSIFLVLLVGLAIGTWWIIQYVFKKNDEREIRMQAENNEREKRYIEVIDKQAAGLQAIEVMQADIKDIKTMVMRS